MNKLLAGGEVLEAVPTPTITPVTTPTVNGVGNTETTISVGTNIPAVSAPAKVSWQLIGFIVFVIVVIAGILYLVKRK